MKKVIKIVFPLLIISVVGVVYYNLTQPTKLNYFVASKIYKAPANNAFTDDNFYKCVVDAYNKENKTSVAYTDNLTDEQLETVTKLDCFGYGKATEEKIINVKGIEKLVNITVLDIRFNNLTDLNVSKNVALKILYANDNNLSKLNIAANSVLEVLQVYNNQLTSLDVSNNTALTHLDVADNQLTTLSVSNNLELRDLNAHSNQLTSLDVSNNTALTHLNVYDNQLTTLSVSNNLELRDLNAHGNRLTSLDVSNNIKLKNLNLMFNNISNIDLMQNVELEVLEIISGNLTQLDISNNPKLTELFLATTPIKKIDLSNNPELKKFSFYEALNGNRLTELDISNNIKLEKLDVHSNYLTQIDLSNNLELKELNVGGNQLTNLDISKNKMLTKLEVYKNPFKYDVGVYLNDGLDLTNDRGMIIYPESKLGKIQLLSSINDNVFINDNIISSDIPGLYEAEVIYNHNMGIYNQTYSGIYNIHVIEATSDKYEINAEEGYIYTGIDTYEETILSNINLNYGQASIENNKLLIKYEGELVKEFNIVNISSDKYNLTKDYIYIGTSNLNLDKLNILNGIGVTEDNKLKIKYNDKILQEYLLVSNSSKIYTFLDNYIYIGSNIFDIEKIDVINGNKELKDNKLLIKYKEDLLNEYSTISVNFGNLKTLKNYIVIIEDLSYDIFVSNITEIEELTYKIYNDKQEITEGNIVPGMTLKVYYNEDVIDEYTIIDEYLEFSENLNIDEEQGLIGNLTVGQTVDDLISNIDTTGTIKIVDQENNEVTGVVGTGYKVVIELSKETIEYTLVVSGDITGDGEIKMSDVMKAANQVLDENTIVGACYLKAADVTGDGKIRMSDVMKLANYIIEGGNN